MKIQQSEFLSYLFFVLGAVVAGLEVTDVITPEIATVLLALLGFSGYASLREFLSANRLATVGVIVLGGAGLIGLATNTITPEQLAEWLVIWGFIGATNVAAGYRARSKYL